MAHNITNGNLYVNGIKVASAFAARETAWHFGDTNHHLIGGQFYTAQDLYDVVDPVERYVYRTSPLMVNVGGALVESGFSILKGGRGRDEFVLKTKPVPSGTFEVVNYKDVAIEFDSMVLAQTDRYAPIETMGMLGDEAKDGFFFTTNLPSDASLEERLGTSGKEFITVYVHPTGRMEVLVGTTLVVCQNTLMIARAGASSYLWTGHSKGAVDRMKSAMSTVYGDALLAQQALHSLLNKALVTPLDEKRLNNFANKVIAQPEKVDESYIGVTSINSRQTNYEQRLAVVEARRAFIQEAQDSRELRELCGITEQMEGTMMAVLQPLTFINSYGATRLIDPVLIENKRVSGLLSGAERLEQQRAADFLLALA